jgi:hypothetical protein
LSWGVRGQEVTGTERVRREDLTNYSTIRNIAPWPVLPFGKKGMP